MLAEVFFGGAGRGAAKVVFGILAFIMYIDSQPKKKKQIPHYIYMIISFPSLL